MFGHGAPVQPSPVKAEGGQTAPLNLTFLFFGYPLLNPQGTETGGVVESRNRDSVNGHAIHPDACESCDWQPNPPLPHFSSTGEPTPSSGVEKQQCSMMLLLGNLHSVPCRSLVLQVPELPVPTLKVHSVTLVANILLMAFKEQKDKAMI